jgi:hypothetical protein
MMKLSKLRLDIVVDEEIDADVSPDIEAGVRCDIERDTRGGVEVEAPPDVARGTGPGVGSWNFEISALATSANVARRPSLVCITSGLQKELLSPFQSGDS